MAKQAIYLDARERKLTRRVFALVKESLQFDNQTGLTRSQRTAIAWTHDEVAALAEKFTDRGPQPTGGEDDAG